MKPAVDTKQSQVHTHTRNEVTPDSHPGSPLCSADEDPPRATERGDHDHRQTEQG